MWVKNPETVTIFTNLLRKLWYQVIVWGQNKEVDNEASKKGLQEK